MGWIYARTYGIMWNAWSPEVSSLNVRKDRLCRMRWKGAFNFRNHGNSKNGGTGTCFAERRKYRFTETRRARNYGIKDSWNIGRKSY